MQEKSCRLCANDKSAVRILVGNRSATSPTISNWGACRLMKKKPPGIDPGGFMNRRAKGLVGDTPGWEAFLGPALGGSGSGRERGPAWSLVPAFLNERGVMTSVAGSPRGEGRSVMLSPKAKPSPPRVAVRSCSTPG